MAQMMPPNPAMSTHSSWVPAPQTPIASKKWAMIATKIIITNEMTVISILYPLFLPAMLFYGVYDTPYPCDKSQQDGPAQAVIQKHPQEKPHHGRYHHKDDRNHRHFPHPPCPL
jgi:hypothetical protein